MEREVRRRREREVKNRREGAQWISVAEAAHMRGLPAFRGEEHFHKSAVSNFTSFFLH